MRLIVKMSGIDIDFIPNFGHSLCFSGQVNKQLVLNLLLIKY